MKKAAAKKEVMLRIRISQDLKDKLEADAAERGISVSELIRRKVTRKPYTLRKGDEESTGKDRAGGDTAGSARR